jgi:hypothetical protein
MMNWRAQGSILSYVPARFDPGLASILVLEATEAKGLI